MKKLALILAVALMVTSCKKSDNENPSPIAPRVEDVSRKINISISGEWDIHTVVVTLNADTVSQYLYVDTGDIQYFTADATKGDVFTVYAPKIFVSVSALIVFSTVQSDGSKVNIEEAETNLNYTVQ